MLFVASVTGIVEHADYKARDVNPPAHRAQQWSPSQGKYPWHPGCALTRWAGLRGIAGDTFAWREGSRDKCSTFVGLSACIIAGLRVACMEQRSVPASVICIHHFYRGLCLVLSTLACWDAPVPWGCRLSYMSWPFYAPPALLMMVLPDPGRCCVCALLGGGHALIVLNSIETWRERGKCVTDSHSWNNRQGDMCKQHCVACLHCILGDVGHPMFCTVLISGVRDRWL